MTDFSTLHSLNIRLPVFDCIIDLHWCAFFDLSTGDILTFDLCSIAVMCYFVVPIRTCFKCHQNEPLFDENEMQLSHANEKNEVL
jgi:hypothetical protein